MEPVLLEPYIRRSALVLFNLLLRYTLPDIQTWIDILRDFRHEARGCILATAITESKARGTPQAAQQNLYRLSLPLWLDRRWIADILPNSLLQLTNSAPVVYTLVSFLTRMHYVGKAASPRARENDHVRHSITTSEKRSETLYSYAHKHTEFAHSLFLVPLPTHRPSRA